jgi:hypothetical protein
LAREPEGAEKMHQDEDLLDRLLVFYRFDDKKSPQTSVFHTQLGLGYRDFAQISLCQEQQHPFSKLMYHTYSHDQKVVSLSFDEGDILYMRAIDNEIVTSGGIWQIQWRNHHDPEKQGYHVVEITSTGFDFVEVDHFLQEDDIVLFEEAVAHAKEFMKATYGVSSAALLNGREVGALAPEHILTLSSQVENLFLTPHTWLMNLTGLKNFNTLQIYVIIEIEYSFRNKKWQYICKALKEYPEAGD